MRIEFTSPDAAFAAMIGELKNIKKYTGDVVWSLTADGTVTITGQEGTLAMLKRLTPKMNNAPDHLADYWNRTATYDSNQVIDTIIIQNTSPVAFPLLKFLEYGTRPHYIRGGASPVVLPGKPLHFVLSDGNEVFASLVWHPGTRPYAMVRQTRQVLIDQLDEVNKAVADIVYKIMSERMKAASKTGENR